MTVKAVWHIVKESAKRIGVVKLALHDLRHCARLCHASGGALEQIQFLLGHVSVQTTERYLGCKQRIRSAVNDHIESLRLRKGCRPSENRHLVEPQCRTVVPRAFMLRVRLHGSVCTGTSLILFSVAFSTAFRLYSSGKYWPLRHICAKSR